MHVSMKILSSLLLFALTFSTIGIVMNKHVCSGSVKNVSAFVKATQCDHANKEEKVVPKCHQQKSTEKKDCCKNDTEEIKNKEQSLAYNKLDIIPLFVLHAFISNIIIANGLQKVYSKPALYESPPLIAMRQPLHKIYEQFLI